MISIDLSVHELVDYALTPDATPEVLSIEISIIDQEIEESKSKRQKKREEKMAKAKSQ